MKKESILESYDNIISNKKLNEWIEIGEPFGNTSAMVDVNKDIIKLECDDDDVHKMFERLDGRKPKSVKYSAGKNSGTLTIEF